MKPRFCSLMDFGGTGVISVNMVNSSSMDLLWVVPSSLFGILSSGLGICLPWCWLLPSSQQGSVTAEVEDTEPWCEGGGTPGANN